MAEDSYVYRLGLDVRDVQAAINTILSATGDLDDQFAAKTPRAIRRTNQALTDLLGQLQQVGRADAAPSFDDRKLLAAEKRQHSELAKLVTELRTAEAAYNRFLEGRLTGRGGGKGIAEYTSADLDRLQSTADVVGARGSFTRDAAAQQRQQVAAVRDQIRAEDQVTDALIRQEAAERQVAAQVERTAQARHAAGQAQVAAIEQAERTAATAATVQNQRRLAGSTIATLSGVSTSNARNSAATNVGTSDQRSAFDQEQLAGLRAYYTAQENAQAATAKASRAIAEQYERQLPRLRYALYDVSTSLGIAGAAGIAAGGVVLKTAADYQSLFAQVRRTSDILTSPSLTGTQKQSAFASLRADLVELSTQIPVTFADITKIATLGNQLGIPSASIANFTKTVAQFSATTNVDVESAATAFGRLGELLNDQNYRKIGDEIAYLGVKSVATESDIINTASQLAVSGQGIKLTTENVLALATSVSSLGVKPEQARGTFIRTFGSIGAAVAQGGAKLNDIARIAGTTADVFKSEFSAGGDSAYRAFLQFTRGLGSSTAEINGNLASIGITAVRDRQTLGLLSQNGSRALKDLENASSGAANGFLNKAYSEQAETVTAKLTTLGNQVKALFDTIGSSATGPIGFLLDRVQGLVGFLQDLAKTPATSQMLALASAGSLVLGVVAVLAAGVVRGYTAFLALQQILAEVGGTTGGVAGAMTALAQRLGLVTAETQSLIGANAALAESQGVVTASTAGSNAAINATTATAAGGVSGVGKLTGALGKAGLAGALIALGLSLPAIGEGIQGIINDLKGATPAVDDLTAAVNGLDAKGADKARATLTKGGQAFGTAPKQQYAYVNGKIQEVGFVQGQAVTGRAISGGAGAVNQILTGQSTLKGQVLAPGADVGTSVTEINNYDKTLSALLASGNQEGFNALLKVYTDLQNKAGVSTSRAEQALTLTREATGATGNQLVTFKTQQDAANDSIGDGTTAANAFTDSLNGLFEGTTGAQTITDDLSALGTSAAQNGAQVAFSSEAMKKAIADIYSASDAATAKGRLVSLYNQLLALGYSKNSLESLSQAIDSIGGAAGKGRVNLSSFNGALDDAKGKADGAAQSVRQLSDYASDLQAAFARSTELRFGNQDATDTLTKGFRDLSSSIQDSRDQLRAAKADLNSLESDRSVTQYQLGVATKFGDTARAAALRAQLGKQNSDIANKRDEIKKDASASSTALTGNSEAALANRARLQPLIQNGQDVLTTMAKNGASPQALEATATRLKKQFLDQGAQLGFRKKDLEGLASAYDDYRKIVEKLPRNLTTKVQANTSPADRALAEYNERLNKLDGKTVSTKVVQQAISLADTGEDLSTIVRVQAQRNQAETDARAKKQKALGFRDGGYTGSAPRWQVAGEVHGDEFVLNSQGYRMFPRQMLEAANHGVAPVVPRVTATATIGSGATMSLGREERMLLAAAGGGGGITVRADRIGTALDQAFVREDRRGSN